MDRDLERTAGLAPHLVPQVDQEAVQVALLGLVVELAAGDRRTDVQNITRPPLTSSDTPLM
jgi:hypothetical protein